MKASSPNFTENKVKKMKRAIPLVLIIILLLSFTACKGNMPPEEYKGNVNTADVTASKITVKSGSRRVIVQGTPVEFSALDDGANGTVNVKLDNGLEAFVTIKNKEFDSAIFYQNIEEGYPISRVDYNKEGVSVYFEEYTYNSAGNKTATASFGEDCKLKTLTIYEYKDDFTRLREYSYDKDLKLIKDSVKNY